MASNIRKNFLYNLFYQILTIILPLVTTPYLARVLGAEKTGNYSYAYSIAYYFVLFAMLGLNNYGNREIARNRDIIDQRSKCFWSIYFLQTITSTIVLIIYCFYCIYLKNNDIISLILIIYVVSAGFDINWFFWGLEEFKITVTRNTIIKLASVFAILLFVKNSSDLEIYTFIMALSNLLSALLLWPYLKGRIQWYKPSFAEIIVHFKPVVILFIPVIAVSLYKVMDKIMLGTLASFSEVGFYEYSEKVIIIPIACVNALGAVMLPRMSNLVAKDQTSEEHAIIKKSIIVGAGLAISMGFGLMSIADIFVPFFYGAGYEKCIYLFYILMPSCAFLAVGNVIRTQFLIPRKRDTIFILSVVGGAIVNLLINFLLIPHLQSVGAAIGTLIAEITVCVYQMIAIRKDFPIRGYICDFLVLLLFGFIMLVIVLLIPILGNIVFTIIIKILVGIIVFGILFYLRYKDLIRGIIKRG